MRRAIEREADEPAHHVARNPLHHEIAFGLGVEQHPRPVRRSAVEYLAFAQRACRVLWAEHAESANTAHLPTDELPGGGERLEAIVRLVCRQAVDFVTDQAVVGAEGLAFLQSSAREYPMFRLRDREADCLALAVYPAAAPAFPPAVMAASIGVAQANQVTFVSACAWIVVRFFRQQVPIACELAHADRVACGVAGEPHRPVASVAAEHGKIAALFDEARHVLAHFVAPVFVVADAQHAAIFREIERASLMKIEVGVEIACDAFRLQPANELGVPMRKLLAWRGGIVGIDGLAELRAEATAWTAQAYLLGGRTAMDRVVVVAAAANGVVGVIGCDRHDVGDRRGWNSRTRNDKRHAVACGRRAGHRLAAEATAPGFVTRFSRRRDFIGDGHVGAA